MIDPPFAPSFGKGLFTPFFWFFVDKNGRGWYE